MKYIKKPVVIEAMQYDGTEGSFNHINEWIKQYTTNQILIKSICVDFLGERTKEQKVFIKIFGTGREDEPSIEVVPRSYIIKGIKNEFYPCKEDIFLETYSPVEEA